MILRQLLLALTLILSVWTTGRAQSQKTNFERPPELEGHAKYLRSLMKAEKNTEVARWFFLKNQKLNSSKYYTLAAKFYALAEKPDSAAIAINRALDNGMSDPNVVEKEGLTSIRETSLWQNIKPKLDALDKKLHSIENFQIDTEPMDSFWPYFNLAIADTSQAKNQLSQYILSGSPATREFYSDIYKSLDEMYRIMMVENSELYENCQKLFTPENLKSIRNNVLTGMNELQKIYPKAVFPKVYMMPGIMNSGGRSTSLGLFVGAEKFIDKKDDSLALRTDAIKSIIMHELMHFQQGYQDTINSEKLIGKVIQEGVCDFLAELCTGIQQENANLEYLKSSKNKNFILSEFKKDLFIEDVSNWMYNYNAKDRPVDIGYTLGYLISKSYYEKSGDEKQAIHNLLNTDNFEEIVARSDYSFVFEDSSPNTKSTQDAESRDKKEIEVEINRNEITFRIAYNLVERELRFPPRPNPVRKNLDKYFSRFKDHKAVLLLSESDIGTDDTFSHYLLHQKEFPEFGNLHDDTIIFEEMEASGYTGVDTLYPMIYKQLNEFYRDANVEKFISDMDFYYSGAIGEIEKIVEQHDIVQQMEDYCKMENYRYVISPEPLFMTGGSRGIGPSVMTESGKICYQFISPSANIDLSNVDFSNAGAVYGYDDKSYIRTISVHEFGHSFVKLNLENETTRTLIDTKGPDLFEVVKGKLENTGIGDFHVYIVEHIVRLLEIRIANKYIGEEEANRIRLANVDFIYLPKMEELIVEKYEKGPNDFKDFSEFIPVLLTAISLE